MWNVNIKSNTIWSVKSRNQYEYFNYEGMSNGSGYVLILRAFTDIDGNKKFIYVKVSNLATRSINNSISVMGQKCQWYIDADNIFTGDQRALESYQECLEVDDYNRIISYLIDYFNLNKIKKAKSKKTEDDIEIYQQRIHKFGIDIFVVENDNVKVNPKNKKLLLSDTAKEDIIYNSKTDEDIRILCDKYQIYPIKAIKEIRNRLVYQHKQKEG